MENPLLELQEYENLQEALKKAKGPVQATGTLDSQKVHLMHWLGKDGGFSWTLVVTYDDQRAREIYDDFRSFTEDVWLYPAKDLLFYSADIHGNLMTRQRIAVWRHLMEEKEGVVVTTLDGLKMCIRDSTGTVKVHTVDSVAFFTGNPFFHLAVVAVGWIR